MVLRSVLLSLGIAIGVRPAPIQAQSPSNDPQAAVAVVRAFRDALVRGDSLGALRLLADDVVILEGGGLETRADYRNHHLSGDIAFARAVPSQVGEPTVTMLGDVAWIASTSKAAGTFRDRPINSAGAELVVLSRGPSGWQIRAIHWSSRTIRTP